MMFSYYEFIEKLKLEQTPMSKLVYELYLDCLKEETDKNKK